MFQKQLEDYLNNLLKMPMYRNYHATVRAHGLRTRNAWKKFNADVKVLAKFQIFNYSLRLAFYFCLTDGVY